MRKLKPGSSEHSFGIHVAQMAGMPQEVVLRANEIMHHLEKDKREEIGLPETNFNDTLQVKVFNASDPVMDQVREVLEKTQVNSLSPIEALLKLNELKQLLGRK
jgi:DNA mismatch repair protein MutS